MVHQLLKLRVLDLPKPKNGWGQITAPFLLFAGIDKREGVKRTRQRQTPGQLRLSRRHGQIPNPATQGKIDRMHVDPPKPVLCIPVVGLPSVKDSVDQRAIGIGEVLDDVVRGIVVIVVQEGRRPEPEGPVGGKPLPSRKTVHPGHQFPEVHHPGPGTRTEKGKLRSGGPLPKI